MNYYKQYSHTTKIPYSENIEDEIAKWVDVKIDEYIHPEQYGLLGIYHESEPFVELQTITTILSLDGKWVHIFAMFGVPK